MRKNRMSLIEYLWDHIFWGFLTAYLFRKLCFRSIPALSLLRSNLVFICLYLIAIPLGFILTYKHHRRLSSTCANLAFPAAIYFCLSFWQEYSWQIVFVGCITTALVLFYTFAVLSNLRLEKLQGKHYPQKKIITGLFQGYRMLIGSTVGLSLLVFLVGVTFGITGFKPNAKVTEPIRQTETIASNINTVRLLQEDEWMQLSMQERLDVLQVIANIEASYLGLPHELNVFSAVMDEKTGGYYVDDTHSIYINLEELSYGTAHEALDTLAHEAYHAYEHRLVELYDDVSPQQQDLLLFNTIAEYRYELSNYIDGDEDLYGYATQEIEMDCRRYAILAVEDYYAKIEAHINNTEQGG